MKENTVTYRRIIDAILSANHTVDYDWTESRNTEARGIDGIVADATRAIEGAELLIAEASGASAFGVGYEVALALGQKKPVLLLVRSDMAKTSYAAGLKDDHLTYRTYDDSNIEAIIRDFIAENDVKNKDLRFNFVIDRKIYNHLRLKSFKSGKTKAEVVRDLLMKDLESRGD